MKKSKKKLVQLLYVEDGSTDLDKLKEQLQGTNIKIIVYRQGCMPPRLVRTEIEVDK